MSQTCSCGSLGARTELTCTEVSCTDAYQFPVDDKQCACTMTDTRYYVVTYCPDKNHQLPVISDNP